MTPRLSHPPLRARAFTLVELMTALVILTVMLLAMSTTIAYVSRAWQEGISYLDNYTKARVMLNLLDRDIQLMILRRDTAAFTDASGNPACAFYTNVEGSPGAATTRVDGRTVSLVQYQLASTGTTSVLQRLNYGMNFATSGVSPAVANSPAPTKLAQLTSLTSLQSEDLSAGVILFQWQFLDGTGTLRTPPAYTFSYSFALPAPSTNPRSVIVSMLVLSNPAYIVATQNSTTIPALQALFPAGSLPSNTTYAAYWNSILNGAAFGTALPAPVRGGLQVFQRQIPLPIVTPSS
jgi:prepilin-type N-terminal cleavage/methylation domain-containing protein